MNYATSKVQNGFILSIEQPSRGFSSSTWVFKTIEEVIAFFKADLSATHDIAPDKVPLPTKNQ